SPRSTKESQMPIGSHQDDVANRDGKIPIDALALGHISHDVPLTRERLAVNPDPAAVGGDHAANGLDERALARSVRTDDADDLPFRDGDIDVPQDGPLVVTDREVVDFDRWSSGAWGRQLIHWRRGRVEGGRVGGTSYSGPWSRFLAYSFPVLP